MKKLKYGELKKTELQEAINLAALVFASSNSPNDETRLYAESEFPVMFSGNFVHPIILVGRDEAQIISMCLIYKNQMTEGNYNLTWVAVHPDFRGKGYGKDIMNYCEQKVLELLDGKPGALSFTTSEKNFDFYKRLGFKKGMSIHKPKSWFHKVYND